MNEGHYIEYMKNNWIKLIKRITLDKNKKDCVKSDSLTPKSFSLFALMVALQK